MKLVTPNRACHPERSEGSLYSLHSPQECMDPSARKNRAPQDDNASVGTQMGDQK